jgi:hypothetical protein
MIVDPKPLPSLRPLVVIGLTAAAALLVHRWWKQRTSPVREVELTPALCRAQAGVEVPWGVEQPI